MQTKICGICLRPAEAHEPTCSACGEASWTGATVAAVRDVPTEPELEPTEGASPAATPTKKSPRARGSK